MNKMGLAAVLLLISVSTAMAQPATEAIPMPPPPQGQGPGARARLQLQPRPLLLPLPRPLRRTNLSINPVGLLMDIYSASLSFAISDRVAIRGDISRYQSEDLDAFTEAGIGLPLYLHHAYDGLFVEPGFITREWSDGDETRGPQMLVGWHVSYDSGWNMAAAIGLGRDLAVREHLDDTPDGLYGTRDYESSEADEVFFNGYFRVGYAF